MRLKTESITRKHSREAYQGQVNYKRAVFMFPIVLITGTLVLILGLITVIIGLLVRFFLSIGATALAFMMTRPDEEKRTTKK